MCVACDLGHREACADAPPVWMQDAIEAVVPILDEIAASGAGDEGFPSLDCRDAYEDAERIINAVMALAFRDSDLTGEPS